MQSVSWNPLIAKFKLLSAAPLNLGWFQNGVLGNGLKSELLDTGLHIVYCFTDKLCPMSPIFVVAFKLSFF